MGEPAAKLHISWSEYLELEKKTIEKLEWLDGVVYDMDGNVVDPTQIERLEYNMVGASVDHARLTVNLGSIVRAQLADKRCAAFSADLKVRVLATGLGAHPDLSVVCGRVELDPGSPGMVATNPTVLFEVLSSSTEAHDRGDKFAHYRRIPSLREYVLVSQSRPFIEVHRKNEAGLWVLVAEAGKGETATLESIGVTLDIDEVYKDPLAEPAA